MFTRATTHLRSNAIAYVALFFALTGAAYAVGPLKPGHPAGGDLTGTYPNPSIDAGAVTGGAGGKVADDTLTGADVDESDLGKVPSSETADRAPVSGFEVTTASDVSLSFPEPGTRLSATASCPAGKKAVGGSFNPIAGGFSESGPEPATPVAVNGAGAVNTPGSSAYFADVTFTEAPPGDANHFVLEVEAVCVDVG